ncbi:Uncharacterised protein [Listeria innocua]|nr:Uncharacterised protein [Listeria innocua]
MNKQNELQSVLSNKKKVLIIGPNGAGESLLLQNLENVMILKSVI